MQDNAEVNALFASAFLAIATAEVITKSDHDYTIQVSGVAATFNYLFQERNIVYESNVNHRLLRGEGSNRRRLFTETFPLVQKEFLDGNPLKVTLDISGSTDASLHTLSDEFRLTGDKWWKFDPYLDFSLEFSTKTDVAVGVGLNIDFKESLWKPAPLEFDFLPEIPIPYAGYTFPSVVVNAINRMVPGVALTTVAGVAVKVSFSAEIKVDFAFDIGGTFTMSSGRKTVQFGLKGDPTDLETLDATFDLPTDEKPSSTANFDSPDIYDVSGGVTLELFAGVAPQIILDAIGKH
mmetsp:Transcript_44739/g.107991  ORF Transcript_44739/g.107991 Transcript_44739/m.107991 type:complete len:293 (-) Transcript_44739:546-1424(-)